MPNSREAMTEQPSFFAELKRRNVYKVPAGLTVANLKYDPLSDLLRKDPRFEKLSEER